MDMHTILEEYAYDGYSYIDPYGFYLNREWFRQRAYALWAAEEILRITKDIQDEYIYGVIEEFHEQMAEFAVLGGMNKDTEMFSVAEDVAQDFLDYMKALREHPREED